MSQDERTGVRSLLYSGWHRQSSIGRYLTDRRAALSLKMVDIDSCEACYYCSAPLALIETQQSAGTPKAATITAALARLAGIPAYSVSYEANTDGSDIVMFRVRRIEPWVSTDVAMFPKIYAFFLRSLRFAHTRQFHPEAWARDYAPPAWHAEVD